MPKTLITVNRHMVDANRKDGGHRPVLSVKSRGRTTYSNEVHLLGQSRVVYNPDRPLSCGATVWIETLGEVLIEDPMDFAEIARALEGA